MHLLLLLSVLSVKFYYYIGLYSICLQTFIKSCKSIIAILLYFNLDRSSSNVKYYKMCNQYICHLRLIYSSFFVGEKQKLNMGGVDYSYYLKMQLGIVFSRCLFLQSNLFLYYSVFKIKVLKESSIFKKFDYYFI